MADKKKDDKKEKEKEKDEAAKAPVKDADKKDGAEGEALAEGEAAEGGKKKLPMKLIIVAGAGVAVLIIVIAVVAMLLMGGKKPAAETAATPAGASSTAQPGKEEAKGGDKKEGAVFYDLGEMVVNLNTDGKRQTFLKLVVQLELENAADKPAIDNLKPRIIDNFQTYMRELRVDDLRGSAGLYRLREELLFRVSEAVHPVKIRDVLFQQMLVQ